MFMTFPGKADNGCSGRSTESNEILTHIQATSPGGFLLQTEGYAFRGVQLSGSLNITLTNVSIQAQFTIITSHLDFSSSLSSLASRPP